MIARRTALVALLLALLAACGPQAAPQPTPQAPAPTPAPAAPPTAAPTDAPAPTAAPTDAPGAVLPRPLYVLQSGQIFRLEPDGATRTQITYEVPFRQDALAVTEFAVSPADGSLVYLVQRAGPAVLVRSGPGGEDPAPLYDDPAVSPSAPLFTPDGQFVAVRLVAPFGPDQSFESGLYLLPLAGGEPQLLVADEVELSAEGLAFGHSPAAFSPDGTRLLTYRLALNVDSCDLAVVSVPDGTAVPVQVPPVPEGERVTTCGLAAWGPDGSAIYYIPSRIGAGNLNTAIWRASPETGESFPITPQPGGPPLTLYAYPAVAADGTLRAFTAQADALPEPFFDQPPALSYSMAAIDIPTGAARELRAPVDETPGQVLWDAQGRGAVAVLFPAAGAGGLWWLPADGGEAVLLLESATDLSAFSWSTP